jgi:adenylate cyclase
VTRLVEAGLPEYPPLKLPDKPSLAVLAFDNLSGDPEKEYMADGISEHIISTLARIPQMFIVSRKSTFYYKGKAVDVRQVARELGVQYVLEGSLQTSGDRVRITAQLIDALSGLHVWSEHYDRSVDDFFALQDDITHKIAVALQVELTRGEQALIETQTTTNLQAWLKFQQAFEAYGAFTPDGNRLARKLLHEAVELDPYFAQAWTFIGWTHFIDARLGYSESRTESLTKSNELVDKAASVHPELPELYLLRAFLHMIEGKLDEAIILGRKLLEVAPGSSNYHAGNAMIMLYAGEFDASIEFMQKAKRLSPLGRTWYDLVLGRAYLLKRDYESAATTFERITTEDTSPVIAAGGHTSMAVLYMETGWEDKARKEIEKALSRASWLSISFYRRVAHYKDPANWWRFETALANAGLPE